ncbi:hypothetical protein SLEP1_g18231 [Rubroshorea leprosula]|uniref:Uncharacterized protein n=1 Tax=Rubroshorea leprosula TaxID=152421 RepID=A0AAV5J5R2_9ROSI|nr:hypothetical protein SLEP1_g18231 [Rubroshorea leprosula]
MKLSALWSLESRKAENGQCSLADCYSSSAFPEDPSKGIHEKFGDFIPWPSDV